jgi:D-xylose transport system substrate-binding protein
VSNGPENVPSVLLTPVAVMKDNIANTVIADKFWSAAQLCTTTYAAACAALGIK